MSAKESKVIFWDTLTMHVMEERVQRCLLRKDKIVKREGKTLLAILHHSVEERGSSYSFQWESNKKLRTLRIYFSLWPWVLTLRLGMYDSALCPFSNYPPPPPRLTWLHSLTAARVVTRICRFAENFANNFLEMYSGGN